MDHSGATPAGWKQVNREHHTRIIIRQCKYLNNSIEQDPRRIKRLTRPRVGFKNLYAAQRPVAGSEVMAMITNGHMRTRVGHEPSFAHMF